MLRGWLRRTSSGPYAYVLGPAIGAHGLAFLSNLETELGGDKHPVPVFLEGAAEERPQTGPHAGWRARCRPISESAVAGTSVVTWPKTVATINSTAATAAHGSGGVRSLASSRAGRHDVWLTYPAETRHLARRRDPNCPKSGQAPLPRSYCRPKMYRRLGASKLFGSEMPNRWLVAKGFQVLAGR
jgi:hypothetical protein